MLERELAKKSGRLHLHPVESRLWDNEILGIDEQIMQWGMPPSFEMTAYIFWERTSSENKMRFIETLLALHQDRVVSVDCIRSLLSCALVSKSFGNRKLLTKQIVSIFELVEQICPSILDERIKQQATHLGIVNDSEGLLAVVGVGLGSLEPDPRVMFALTDACSIDAFRWVKPYDLWSTEKRRIFLDLFMEQCVRRHPSNNRQQGVLQMLLKDGFPQGFELKEKDIVSKESVRASILSCEIRIDPSILRRASPQFRMAMAKAGLATTTEANIAGSRIDKMLRTDLGL